jgi:hypothetical protein
MPAAQWLPSKMFFAVISLAMACSIGGFAWLLGAAVIHPWGVIGSDRHEPFHAFAVVLWITCSCFLFILAFRIGTTEAEKTGTTGGAQSLKKAMVINSWIAAEVVSGFGILQIGGFTALYVLPLFSLHPPVRALFLGAPLLVLTMLLFVWGCKHWRDAQPNEGGPAS